MELVLVARGGRPGWAAWLALFVALAACGESAQKAPVETLGPGGSDAGAGGTAAGSAGGAGRAGDAGSTQIEPGLGQGGEAGAACEREVTLTAVTLGEPQPFDLVIVADHSDSLAWSREDLSRGLSDLLSNIAGRDARVFLLTPTQYGASSAAALAPFTGDAIVAWQDPATGEPYQDAATEYSEVCTDPAGATIDCPGALGPDPYIVEGSWRFVMPEPIARLTADMSEAEFEAEQAKVASAILGIGGTGSPQEMPLCTLGRYLAQEPSLLPENAVFLVISDEDDVSVPEDCLVGFTGQLKLTQIEVAGEPCSEDCDSYRFTVDGESYQQQHSFECAAFDDLGNLIPGSEQSGQLEVGPFASCGIEDGPCEAGEVSAIALRCDSGKVLTRCDRRCTPVALSCSVDFTDPEFDACTQPFAWAGAEHDNLADYCSANGSNWQNCRSAGVNRRYVDSYSGSFLRHSLMPGQTTADVGAYVRSRANAIFSQDGYLLQAIVFDERFACELGEGQSYANNISAVVADDAHVFPLCDSYAPALEGVWDFAQTLIQTEFPLALKEDEQITSVVVIGSDGTERVLAPGAYTYDAEGALLSVDKVALRGTDASLRVEVTSDCRPEPR